MRKLLVLAALAAGCNNNVIQTPIRVFDRPSDVALTCVRGEPPANQPIPADPHGAVYVVHDLTFCAPEFANQNTLVTFDPNSGVEIDYPPIQRAMVTNSARGEVALVDISAGQIVDLNRAVPGFGFLPVGGLPEHVRISKQGCQAVTTNADSCDLAVIDMERLHNSPRLGDLADAGVSLGDPAAYSEDLVRRVQPAVKDAGGNFHPLGARPTWIEYASDADGTPDPTTGTCSQAAQSAWVAMPGCQLVAEVSLVPQPGVPPAAGLASPYFAEVKQAIRVTRTSATLLSPAELATLSCPAECSGEVGSGNAGPVDLGGPPADGGVDGGSSLPTTQGMPGTIAVDAENGVGRLFIGDLAGETLWIVPFTPNGAVAGGPTPLGAPRAVTLERGANGVEVVRVSPRSQAGKFLYAVARDASVRVVDLDRELECETNPDPRTPLLLAISRDASGQPIDPATEARTLGCFPLGAPGTPPRNPSVVSPGITLQGNALPKDITFVHLDVPPPPTDINGNFDPSIAPAVAGPSLVVGDFAWIVGSEGRATLVNIFDACPAPNVQQNPSGPFTPACDLGNMDFSFKSAEGFAGHPDPIRFDRMAHRLRQGNNKLGAQPVNCTDNGGAPRIQDESPGNNFSLTVNGTAAGAAVDGGAISQPSLYQAMLTLDPVASPQCASSTARSIAVYDPDHIRNENWDLTWEGQIPGTVRSTITPGQGNGNGADVWTDPGGAWCSRGVKAGDKLWLVGCTTDADCDFAQTCVRDPAQPPDVPNGLCLDRVKDGSFNGVPTATNTSPPDPQVAKDCSLLLRSMKHYRILHAYQGAPLPSGEISDWLRVSEIYEPEHPEQTHVCAVDGDCADVHIAGPQDPNGLATTLPTRCLADSDGVHRCLRACDPNATDVNANGCGIDFLCVGPGQSSIPAGESGRCMRSPLDAGLFARCLNELQPYEIHAGEAFLVNGSASGYLNDYQPDPVTRECVVPPVSSPFVRLHQGRIPLGGPDLQWCPMPSDPRYLHNPAVGPAYDPLAPLDPSIPNVCLDPGPAPMLTACTPGAATTGCAAGDECLARSDAAGGFCQPRGATRAIHFENTFYAIELNVPPRPSKELASSTEVVPIDATDLKFIVVGGCFPLATALGVDAQAQQPRAIVTGPDRQTVFVVDEGKQTAATGLRGQLLRVSTAAQSTDRSFQVR